MKKFVSTFVTLLILCSFLVTLPKINMVKASETIYIRADGTVEGTDKIQRDGNVYTFTGDINGSVVVERDNIVVDGAGYTLQGTGNQVTGNGTGIYLGYRYRYNGTYDSRKNVTIKNMQIKYFDHGIWLDAHTSNNTVSGNKITSCIWGIYLLWSSYNTITGNKITNNYRGIQLVKSSNSNGISANNITNNRNGIYLFESSQNTINGNNITNSEIGIVFDGSHDHIYHNNFINNTKQVEDICWTNPWLPSSANILDDGYPSGGNYWSDYEDRYPNATELDDSGIWGTPYVIDANNQDRYPLMNPVAIPEFPNDEKPTTPTNEPFPITWIIAAIVIIAVVGVAFLVYFTKVKKTTEKTE